MRVVVIDDDRLVAASQILKQEPDANILFLTTFSDDEYLIRALRMGAKGYILTGF